jgi:2-polyprenyl-3-methyl-5-hydroxy-6-metoxy-1,4-benzoquinol methylase
MTTPQDPAISPLLELDEGGPLRHLIHRLRTASRLRRAALFRSHFELSARTRILDLGGSSGAHVHALLADTPVQPANVCVADVDHPAVREAARFGYVPVALEPGRALPFDDGSFDVVLCSSVLEHVTIPPQEVWQERSGARFARRAREQQRSFARELARVGRGYFVQVPNRWFPVETHSWLPFLGYLPRALQCAAIALGNRVWIKKTVPDFYLPTAAEMREYFPAARLQREKVCGLTKSLIAVKTAE